MFNRFSFRRTYTVFTLLAMSVQMFSFTIFGQSFKTDKFEEMPKAKQNIQDVQKSKIAPDLEKKTDELFYMGGEDQVQKVIIQLKSETPLNEMLDDTGSFGNAIGKEERENMFAREVRANKSKTVVLKTDLAQIGGRMKKSFNRLGLVSAELPLSKIRELVSRDEIAYISPDSPTRATGHIEMTTGTSQARNLISPNTQLDGRGIGVAILDSGIDGSHMLVGAAPGENRPGVVFNKDFTMTCTWCWDTNVDIYGHGTHVATMLAGRDGNYAYTGVAPNVKLLNLRVLNSSGAGTVSNVVAAIDWVIENKAVHNIRVINMSLGTAARDSYRNDPLCLASRRAVNAGIVVVASAGNNGKDAFGNKLFGSIGSPGIEPSVITVGASNTFGTNYRSDDAVATYSSRGPTRGYITLSNGARKYDNLIKPDLVAPGNKIIGAVSTYRPQNNSTRINSSLAANYSGLVNNPQADEYARTMYLSGTSMAAPLVAGTAALMLQAKPNLTPNLVKAILMYSAQPLNGYSTVEQGAGELNVEGAIRITNLVKSTLPTTNGTSLLTNALPTSQTSTIGGETVYWGKGVITNFGFLSGNDLMNKWQGMYASGTLMSDSTPFSGSGIVKSSTLTYGSLNLFQGVIKNNGVIMGDGTLMLSAIAMGGTPIPYVNSQGVLVSDGVTMGDGVLVSDGVIMGDGNMMAVQAILGDNTVCMIPGQ